MSRLISAQDDERLRIATNLHDDLGQQVTALRLKLDAVAAAVPAASGTAVAQVPAMLHQIDERLHFVASHLRPSALNLGLSPHSISSSVSGRRRSV